MLAARPLARLADLASIHPLFVVDRVVYACPSWREWPAATARVGALSAMLRPISGADPHARVPETASDRLIARIAVLRFVLGRLLPLLRYLREEREDRLSPDPPVAAFLATLDEVEAAVRRSASAPANDAFSTEAAATHLGDPCAILGRTVAPLAPIPVGLPTREGLEVTVDGRSWRIGLEQARPFTAAEARMVGASAEWTLRWEARSPELREADVRVRSALDALLADCGARDCREYWLLFDALCIQVQVRQGDVVLVHGPLRRQGKDTLAYVALPIRGSSREQWLATRPEVLLSADTYWTPVRGRDRSVCFGPDAQYAYLRSLDLPDAQAVLLWLDAAADLVTGRSVSHARLRLMRMRRLAPSIRQTLRSARRA